MGFPGGTVVKNLPANAGPTGCADLIPGQEYPLEMEMQPNPIFLPGKSHGQRILADYNPCDLKESDTIEHPCIHTSHSQPTLLLLYSQILCRQIKYFIVVIFKNILIGLGSISSTCRHNTLHFFFFFLPLTLG